MCYGIIILFMYKVLLYVMFEGFEVVGVVSCGRCDNIIVLLGVIVLL